MDARQTSQQPIAIQLTDYQPPAWLVEKVDLDFELNDERTIVTSTLQLAPNTARPGPHPIRLDGEDLELLEVKLNGEALGSNAYVRDEESLTLPAQNEAVTITLKTAINPKANMRLEGLYQSGGNFCTQCEAEGFRRITYYPDRPDVMSRFTVTMRADKSRFPVLLSNGNLSATRDCGDGRHEAVWDDPHMKPAYLFALVAGDLERIEDSFTTMSGRNVDLHIYVEHGKGDRALYAMDSLKRSMAWDEQAYGREYDLDLFNIVAVSDFNMGAMENKSLNVFNDKLILADADTATDLDFAFIESVVGHEYFHNWSGNRVTCRDWFQLSLKEGFTVFRDQQFSAHERSEAVQRIGDVRTLRARQFPEDAGPLAHPVRPASYIEINNFYTATVYEKGAEVVRMLHTLLGADTFRKGSDIYFDRHDGQAVTCDDFVAAMEAASGEDLSQFKLWYSQAGTPRLAVSQRYDAATKTLAVTFKQSTKPTPGQPDKQALVIPLSIGLIGADGTELQNANRVLRTAEETFCFDGVGHEPVLSLNRGFAAPVVVERFLTDREAALLMAHDTDPFARWEAAQDFATRILLDLVDGAPDNRMDEFVHAFGTALSDPRVDNAYKAELLSLPATDYVTEQMDVMDVASVFAVREKLVNQIAQSHKDALTALYNSLQDDGPYSPDAQSAGKRALKNVCLFYLDRVDTGLAEAAYQTATNMTDRMAALRILCRQPSAARDAALLAFEARYTDNPLVMDKWFAVQATAPTDTVLDDIKRLMTHRAFSLKNPNKVRSLIGAFAMQNSLQFHRADGAAYRFHAEQIAALDGINPQIAARLVAPLGTWRRVDNARAKAMQSALEGLLAKEGLSRDVYELASKALEG